MSEKPNYKLLKDLPGIPAGFICTLKTGAHADFYFFPCVDSSMNMLKQELVENTPEWFERIKEKKYTIDEIIEKVKGNAKSGTIQLSAIAVEMLKFIK